MTLSDLREIIVKNKKKLVLAGGGLAVLGITLSLIFGGRDGSVPLEGGFPSFSRDAASRSLGGGVSLALLPQTEFPEAVPRYRVESSGGTLPDEEVQAIAQRFGFAGDPQRDSIPDQEGEVLIFSKSGESLVVTTFPRNLNYSRSLTAGTGTVSDGQEAFQQAKIFLSDRGLSIGDLSPLGFRYLSSNIGGEESVVLAPSRAEADFVEVIFSRSVGGREILGETPASSAAAVRFNRADQVLIMTYQFADYSLRAEGEAKLIPYQEALADLGRDGVVVGVHAREGADLRDVADSSLSSFAPDSVRLAYVQSAEFDYLYPVYVFEGEGTIGRNEVRAVVYLPAVSL